MTTVVASMMWLLLSLWVLFMHVRVAFDRFTIHPDPAVRREMQQLVSSPFMRWVGVFVAAWCLIGAWFARGEGPTAVLVFLTGVAFAMSAWLGWRTHARLVDEEEHGPHAPHNRSSQRWLNAVPLGVTGMAFVLAAQVMRGVARNSPSTTLDLAMTLSVGFGLVLLVAAGITAAMDLSAKADRTYKEKR